MKYINIINSDEEKVRVNKTIYQPFKDIISISPHYEEQDAKDIAVFIYLYVSKKIPRRDVFVLMAELYINNVQLYDIITLKDSDILYLIGTDNEDTNEEKFKDIMKKYRELKNAVSIYF